MQSRRNFIQKSIFATAAATAPVSMLANENADSLVLKEEEIKKLKPQNGTITFLQTTDERKMKSCCCC